MSNDAVNGCPVAIAVIPVARAVTVTAIAVPGMAVISAAPVAVIPGARPDKDAVYEPARTVVAVWSASVWVIRVVAIRADRGRTHSGNHRTYANAYRDLSMSASSEGEKQNT